MPPRSLKSICASVAFPAWILGKDPNKRIITTSYSDELASKLARDCRAVMDTKWYKELFPQTRLNPNKRTETEYETTQNGYRLATSVGGTLTGRGGNFIIIDDPIKPQEALSETRRKSVNQWYANTLYSRLDNKNTDVIIIVMQRVHADDLCSFVQENEDWEVLNLPAIATKDEVFKLSDGREIYRHIGEVLNPQLESQFILETIKKNLGNYNFEAQYQQNPIPEEGNILKWKWFNYYDELPQGGMIVQSWDTASSDSNFADYTVGITALVKDNQFYIIDILRNRLLFPELKRKVKELYEKYNCKKLIIENKASGIALIQQLRSEYNIYPIAYESQRYLRKIEYLPHPEPLNQEKYYCLKMQAFLMNWKKRWLPFLTVSMMINWMLCHRYWIMKRNSKSYHHKAFLYHLIKMYGMMIDIGIEETMSLFDEV